MKFIWSGNEGEGCRIFILIIGCPDILLFLSLHLICLLSSPFPVLLLHSYSSNGSLLRDHRDPPRESKITTKDQPTLSICQNCFQIWHKSCFKCQVCNMTLNMKNYKGFDKLPYCGAHVPKAKATTVVDTPEMRRLAENSKIQVRPLRYFFSSSFLTIADLLMHVASILAQSLINCPRHCYKLYVRTTRLTLDGNIF